MDSVPLAPKRCSKCSQLKPANCFYSKGMRNGQRRYSSECRDCTRERRRAYWAQYRNEHKDEINARLRAWYADNPTPRLEAHRRFIHRNPDNARARSNKYRARLRDAAGEHTAEEIQQMCEDQQGLCAYCEIPLFGFYHVDHMTPLCRGSRNDWTNLAITCPNCNQRKKDRTLEEFWEYLKQTVRG